MLLSVLAAWVFASLIALQNMPSRYLYSHGNDGMLLRQLGAAHLKHGSPCRAAPILSTSGLAGIIYFTTANPGLFTGLEGAVAAGLFVVTVLVF